MPRSRGSGRARGGRGGAPAVAGLGEFALIERLAGLVPTAGPGVTLGLGDDAAVLEFRERVLATCDVQAEDVHFRFDVMRPADVGWRALAVNLSDIAAMGGTPRYALVSLLVRPDTAVRVVEGIYRGLAASARASRVIVVGGNVSRSPGGVIVDVTLLGESRRVLGRAGARPGDGLWITGAVGKAAAGLFLASRPDVRVRGGAALRAAYRRPTPRLAAGRALARTGVVTAALDTSDGTAGDLLHLAEASRVGVLLDEARLPIPPGLTAAAAAAGRDPMAWALSGGEDYELLFAARPSFARAASRVARAAGVPITRIGDIVPPEAGRWIVGRGGRPRPLVAAGWDHLAGTR